MKNSHHKYIAILVVIVLFGSIYTYFIDDLKSEAATPISGNSDLSSTATADLLIPANFDENLAKDIAFLSTLSSLKEIKIDTAIFNNQAFQALNYNVVTIEPVTPGRQNPFSPVGANAATTVNAPKVTTSLANLITDKSAFLSGRINISSGVTSIYFEYGPTRALGLATVPVKASLTGTFEKNITGLTAKTSYYFRAIARINGILVYGDIVSFTTN